MIPIVDAQRKTADRKHSDLPFSHACGEFLRRGRQRFEAGLEDQVVDVGSIEQERKVDKIGRRAVFEQNPCSRGVVARVLRIGDARRTLQARNPVGRGIGPT